MPMAMEIETCVSKSRAGIVDVHNTQICEELTIDNNDHIRTLLLSREEAQEHRQRYRRPQSMAGTNKCEFIRGLRTMDPQTLIGHTLKLQDWLNEKRVKNIQEKADLEAKNTRQLCTGVLDTENTFVKELESLLAHKEALSLRKRELLHKQWTENVHEPIRQQIDRQMHGPAYEELAKRKRQQHKEYLEHVNRKGHVFLDTIAPDEYYAMSLHPTRPSPLTAQTKVLRDPLLTQERERTEEERVIFRCMTGTNLNNKELRQFHLPPLPLVPLGRHGTECRTWLAMPMGDIESPVRMASRQRFKPDNNTSQIDFKRWAQLSLAEGAPDEELKVQCKRMYVQELPNDRTQSHSAVVQNCGGPPRRQRRKVPNMAPVHIQA